MAAFFVLLDLGRLRLKRGSGNLQRERREFLLRRAPEALYFSLNAGWRRFGGVPMGMSE
jgi:hypothetical protein